MAIPNQAPDSSVAGFLLPIGPPPGEGPAPLAGDALDDVVQQLVAGVAGLDGTMVRPRWQEDVPNLPDWGVDWAAVGLTDRRALGDWAATIHYPDDPSGPGHDTSFRHEELGFLVSFYGTNADLYAQTLASGLSLWQNRSALRLLGLALYEVGDRRRAPEFIKGRWWNRVDLRIGLRQIIRRDYAVLNLLAAPGQIATETYQTGFTAEQPVVWDDRQRQTLWEPRTTWLWE